MPKRLSVFVKLPEQQPDRCQDCPLLGLIPVEMRKHGSKKTHVCLGTYSRPEGNSQTENLTRGRVTRQGANHWCGHAISCGMRESSCLSDNFR